MIRYHSFDHLGLPVIRAHQGCHRKLAGCDVTHAGSVEHQDSRRKGKLERLGRKIFDKQKIHKTKLPGNCLDKSGE